MSIFDDITSGLLSGAGQLLSFIPQGNIGGISVQATLEETYTDSLEVTDHPVEAGAQITDHSFVRPQQLIMKCGWSNASTAAAVSGLVNAIATGTISGASYVAGVYSQLLALQQSRQPFTVVATARQYTSMLLTSIELTRDVKTSQALMVTATMKQVILVSTQTTSLPPTANQANPANTAETQNTGNVQPQAATPAPGGSFPPDSWEDAAP